MPTYEYKCSQCCETFDIIKSVKELNDPECCPQCSGFKVERMICRTHFYGASDWDKAEYNPGLGVVTKNAKHRDKLARERGMIEVGNESLEKTMDSQAKKLEGIVAEAEKPAFDKLEYGLKKEMGKI